MIKIKKPTRRAKQWLEPEGLALIEGWARDGLTEKQIAHNVGVSYATFRTWRDDYTKLSAALKNGKEVADRHVEGSLYKRANGFYYEETKITTTTIDGVPHVKKEVFNRYALPDTTAQIFWLKNRKPADWRDRITHSVEAEELSKVDQILKGMTEKLND